jgi:anaerobic magnesium-protoporphyrin IX monomethyl ester cyclase
MEKKKILFLKARTGMDDPSPPMAFSFLASIAEEEGFDVLVENLNAQYNEKTNRDIAELIKREKPEIVGVHIFTNAARYSYELIKEIRPFSKLILAGGPHPTACAEEVLERGVDIAFIGETEISFRKFLKAFNSKNKFKNVKGIVYKENGRIIKTKLEKMIYDLDKIPMPDKNVNRQSDYVKIKDEINNFGQILSTRGCPGRCTYCFSLFEKCFRVISAEKVFEEIKFLHEKFGINFINFIDDAFTVNKKRVYDICDLLIKSKMPIKWSCGTRVDFLDKDMLIKMKDAGCKMITFGIESAIPKTLLGMKKTANPEWYVNQADKLLKWCYELGIRVGVNILAGFPWENAEDMKFMQKYVHRIKKYVTQGFYGGILQPQPETEMYKTYAKEYGFEKWWVNKKPLFKDDYRPFFMAYYHVFWDHLHNNFFKFNKEYFSEIDKLYKIMGKWNLYILTKRRFKNLLVVQSIYQGLFVLSNFSILLYGLSPNLERGLMERIKKFSYRFKFRKGDKKLN